MRKFTLAVLLFIVAMVVRLYTTFVLENLWNWFVSDAFHLSHISFWVMYGVVLFIGLLTVDFNYEQARRFKVLAIGIDACIPENLREMVNKQLEDQDDQVLQEGVVSIIGT